jgi:GNAT superfamily N-acetyltransferase
MRLLNPDDLHVVACRPALPKDTPDVMALTSQIWDGHDYVPHAWQEWLDDPQGILAVAEYAGRVVGLAKLSSYGDDQWWLQGLRVDPEYQGRGIASRLHHYILDYWERRCGGALRLATSSARLPVHHLCEQTGFRKVGEYNSYVAPALNEPVEALTPISEGEAGEAFQVIRHSEVFMLENGLINLFWQWGELNIQHLVDGAREERLCWWNPSSGEKGALMFGTDEEDGEALFFLQLTGCAMSDLPSLLMDFRRLAAQRGCSQAAWMAPATDGVREALDSAGFVQDWDHSLYLYEKRLGA